MPDALPHVLYITHRVPFPPDKGDRIRNYNVLRQLVEHARVTLASLDDEGLTLDFLDRFGDRIAGRILVRRSHSPLAAVPAALAGRSLSEGAFRSGELEQRLTHDRREPFDAAIVSASSLAPYLRLPALRSVPAIVDVVDVDSRKWFDFAEAVRWPKRMLYRFESRRLQRLECELAGWAHTIALVSDAETALFNSVVGRDCAITATNGVDLENFQPRAGGDSALAAFLGAMDYLPNIDACTWFVREVWPGVRARHPAARFRIVGRNPTRAVQALATAPGVEVTGSVPDVRPHVAEAAVIVAPLRLGRGLQNKVLEAMACGRAVVAAPAALTAIRAVPGRDLLRAESREQWIEAVASLFDDSARRKELGRNARRFVEENHDWEKCLRPLMDRILAACPQGAAA